MKITYRYLDNSVVTTGEVAENATLQFDAGAGTDYTAHDIDVAFSRASDGTIGIEITGMQGLLRIEPRAANRIYITTQRPDRLKKD